METLYKPLPLAGHNSSDSHARYDAIADDLARQGWCVVSHYFPDELLSNLQSRLQVLQAQAQLTLAGVGRGDEHTEALSVRRDMTHWLEGDDATEKAFLLEMEALREALNRRLMLGIFLYEAHFALYEKGAFYARHVDSFRGQKNRIISTVLYLNDQWQSEDGGMLALFADEQAVEPFLAIAPEKGTFVLFLSEDVPHEVQMAHRDRASIAGWFRCNEPLPLMQ